MRILCNLPLESFDDRENLRGVELCTFGPRDRMRVEGVHYPLDVEFDPSRGSIDELFAALPRGFVPDVLMLWWPDQEPLPKDLHRCPVPTVGVVSDYNLTLPTTARLQALFDVLLCDKAGVEVFTRVGQPDVRWFCQYSWKRPFHLRSPELSRSLDVAFAGNLNAAVQRERAPWIARLLDLETHGVRTAVHQGVNGSAYGDLLGRSKLGFNRSIRGEMNLRAFEVPAAGAVLLMERENLEVRDFFVPDEECVLYGQDDFEAVVLELLGDEPRRKRIACAGHRRAMDHSLGNRMPQLCELLQRKGPGRDRSDGADARARLGRAEAMLTTWASGEALVAAAMDAVRAAPRDARALQTLAVATVRWRGATGANETLSLLQRAAAADSAYVPPAVALAHLLRGSDRPDLQVAAEAEAEARIAAARSPADLVGPVLPFLFAAQAVDWARALVHSVRTGDNDSLIRAVRPTEPRPLIPATALG